MPLSINTNLMAGNAANNLKTHYARLSTSVRRLASGLRVNAAADDAAGLAIRELMRADLASLHQGVRNANDAISMIQVADGALAVIDEKLIRMKELAEQAATGTYTSTQRLMIHSEFQAMASEIDRIANATDFNGIKLLDGSLTAPHNGSGLSSAGAMKIHFGTANASAEDYYYVEIGNCTLAGLGLRDEAATTPGGDSGTFAARNLLANNTRADPDPYGGVPILSDAVEKGVNTGTIPSGIVSLAIIPTGSEGINLYLNDLGYNDTFQIFTRSGQHIVGTDLMSWGVPTSLLSTFMIESNGFLPGATYNGTDLNGMGGNLTFQGNGSLQYFDYNNMNIGYSGDAHTTFGNTNPNEYLIIRTHFIINGYFLQPFSIKS